MILAHMRKCRLFELPANFCGPRLDGCVIYASGHPCPMCLTAMHLTGIREVYFAYSNEDGEPFGLSTASLYEEMAKPLPQQSIKMEHRPVRSEDHLYAVWQRRTEKD